MAAPPAAPPRPLSPPEAASPPAATPRPGPVTAAALGATGEMAAPAAPRVSPAGVTAGPAVPTPGGPVPRRVARTFPAARVRTRRSRLRSPRAARSGCSTPLRPWTAERTWRPAPARVCATTSPRSAATTHAPAVRAGSTSAATATPAPVPMPNPPGRTHSRPAGRTGFGVSVRQDALDSGFHGVPTGAGNPDCDADGAGVKQGPQEHQPAG